MEPQSRREFLSQSSSRAIGMIVGVSLFGNELAFAKETDPSVLFKKFKDRLDKECKPGIVVVIPTTLEDQRTLIEVVSALIRSKDQRLLTQSILACLPRRTAANLKVTFTDDVCLIAVDIQCNPAKPVSIPAEKLGEDFQRTCGEMIFGTDNEKLADIAKAQEKSLGEEKAGRLKQTIAHLNADEQAERDKAIVALEEQAGSAPAILLQAQLSGPDQSKRPLEQALAKLAKPLNRDDDATLPFGVLWAPVKDPCPKCGRTEVKSSTRPFIRFIANN